MSILQLGACPVEGGAPTFQCRRRSGGYECVAYGPPAGWWLRPRVTQNEPDIGVLRWVGALPISSEKNCAELNNNEEIPRHHSKLRGDRRGIDV